MAGTNRVEAFLAPRVYMGGNDFSNEDYVVAGENLFYELTFKIGYGIAKQNRINLFGRCGFAVELGQFVDVPA